MTPGGGPDEHAVQLDVDDLHPGAAPILVWPESGLRTWRFAAPGVMSAAQACRLVIGKASSGFFTGPEQVHLLLTTYAKGEPVEAQGDISYGMPPRS